ncbi:unnamed protein product [Lupinus luteus]|uniref:Uncharacterized protein n=1 Tax=Lupinus luteus TaxID=3873 RepID=A0AAV1XTH0_LUPLU
MGLPTKQSVPSFQNSSSSIITKEPQEVETILVEKRVRVKPLARVRVDEVKEFRLGQFRPVEANEREKRSTTRAEVEETGLARRLEEGNCSSELEATRAVGFSSHAGKMLHSWFSSFRDYEYNK